jgi:hypothetical protein
MSAPESSYDLAMNKKTRELVPAKLRAIYESIVEITDKFCEDHLNQEYAEICRKMAATLSRKRPSPLTQGKLGIWACAIVYAIGKVNFLFDKTQTPHLRADELCTLMGVSQSSASAKAGKILDLLDIMQLDPEWCLPSKIEQNPLAWLIQVNGFIVDARYVPREIQEEAYRKGLIPYIP